MPDSTPSPASFRLAATAGCAAAFAYCVFLGELLARGAWIRDSSGHPIVTDFLPVYVAGILARRADAATAYDWQRFHAAQTAFVGHGFTGFLGWHYPPLFFLVAMGLTLAGYLPAFLAWVGVTMAGFAATVAAIGRDRGAVWMALSMPPTLACALVGQNGFFSAALFGGMLLCLPRRPLLAGALLAALTFKPQFGLLIPFALIAGGYYRPLFIAALLTIAWIGIALWLSPAAFAGFLHYLPQTSHAVLTDGTAGWEKLQSSYAAARLMGLGDTLGWGVQIATAVAAGVFCVWLWRQKQTSFALKAAALACGALLATPYVYFYDLPILALPLAFLFRDSAIDRSEQAGIAVIFGLLGSALILPLPMGLPAILVTAGMVVRRALVSLRA